MYDRVNRTTWQVSRKTVTMPGANSASVTPTVSMQIVGAYIASNVPGPVQVKEIPGSPIVAVDRVVPTFPPDVDIREGDFLLDMEKGQRYEVVKARVFPSHLIAWLKTVKDKSNQ